MYLFLKIQPRQMVCVMRKLFIQIKNQPPLQLQNLMVCCIFKTFKVVEYFCCCIGKQTAPWNTRLQVCISNAKKRNFRDFGKANNGKYI